MSRPYVQINCCTSTKIRSDYLWTFVSNAKKHQINKNLAASTGDGKTNSRRKENKNSLFDAIGLSDPDTGKLYIGLPGIFPVTNNREIHYMLILYVYETNTILVETIKK